MTKKEYADMRARVLGAETEAKVRALFKKECKARGWVAASGRPDRRTGRLHGENDFYVILPDAKVQLVELKKQGGVVSKDQKEFAATVNKLGHPVHIVIGRSGVRLWVKATEKLFRQGFLIGDGGSKTAVTLTPIAKNQYYV